MGPDLKRLAHDAQPTDSDCSGRSGVLEEVPRFAGRERERAQPLKQNVEFGTGSGWRRRWMAHSPEKRWGGWQRRRSRLRSRLLVRPWYTAARDHWLALNADGSGTSMLGGRRLDWMRRGNPGSRLAHGPMVDLQWGAPSAVGKVAFLHGDNSRRRP